MKQPKLLIANPVTVWYIVLDLPFRGHGRKLKRINDVRLYEVSPSSAQGALSDRLGMMVAGKTQGEAYDHAIDILLSYRILGDQAVEQVSKKKQEIWGAAMNKWPDLPAAANLRHTCNGFDLIIGRPGEDQKVYEVQEKAGGYHFERLH